MSGEPYEAVYARPDGESTVSRLALTAREQGYAGVVVRNHGDADHDADLQAIAAEFGVDVVDGVEVRGRDRSQVASFLSRHRPDRVVVCVHGGDPAINRLACEDPRVDVLAHPTRGDGDVNHVLARSAADNGVRVEFDFGPVLRRSGGERVQALRALRKLRELVEKYDAPYVVSGGAASHLSLRAPREFAAVGEVIGFDADRVEAGLAEWGRLAARNRERRSEEFIGPGVRTGRYEEDC